MRLQMTNGFSMARGWIFPNKRDRFLEQISILEEAFLLEGPAKFVINFKKCTHKCCYPVDRVFRCWFSSHYGNYHGP